MTEVISFLGARGHPDTQDGESFVCFRPTHISI